MPVGIAIVVVRYGMIGISKELDKEESMEGRADLGVRLLPKGIYSLAVVRVRYKIVLPPVESLERWPPSFLQLEYGITGM